MHILAFFLYYDIKITNNLNYERHKIMIFFQFFFVTMFEIVRVPMNLKIFVGQERFYFKGFSKWLIEKC